MERLSRYGRRMRLTFITALFAACFMIMWTIPFFTKNLLYTETGFYSITINGIKVGAANSESEVIEAYASARQELSAQYESVVYMSPEIEIVKEDKKVAQRMDIDELSDAIYSCMFDNVLDIDMKMVYTVRIGDYTATLKTEEEVLELFGMIVSKYDVNNTFDINMVVTDATSGTYGITIKQKASETTAAEIVSQAISGTAVSEDGQNVINGDGLTSISFSEDVVVTEVSAQHAVTTTVSRAYEDITKEHEEKTYYTVVAGDCLSLIAENNGLSLSELLALNSNLNEGSVIAPGDDIVITVPKSQITVVTKRQMAYEEDFEAEPTYVDDENNYRGTNTVISEGTVGHRAVIAEVTYANGNETGRTYLQENIMKESVSKVIAVGILTPPTYIRPIRGGSLSSEYGYRWGSFHSGVDWAISQGNTVSAAAEGTVTRAGWFSGYGYCVDIQHNNGTMTRYGHLSAIYVSTGQHVSQGQSIAATGNTGQSTGPHLHFEIWIGGRTVNPLNYVNKY